LTVNPPPNKFVNLTKDTCIANLNNIGVSLGSSSKGVIISFNALKQLKVDKTTVLPRQKGDKCIGIDCETNPFTLNDDEEPEVDRVLLAHLVNEVPDVDLDCSDLATRLCDLRASRRKPKSSSKKHKARKRPHKTNKSVSP